MKKLFTLLFFFALAATAQAQATIDTIQGEITANRTITKNKVWILKGFVYVKNGATLTIEAGTVIKGDKASKGTLIVTRGAKVNAVGTVDGPIVFTSNQPANQRKSGDWGGIIILGRSAVNSSRTDGTGAKIQGEAVIEGGIDNANGDGVYGGGANPILNDNSGTLQYVRIEFGGIAFGPNNEINSLTLGGVGSGTTVNYVQTSFGGDDAFEWFGGTVNAKYLVSLGTTDDDFDTDFGFSGKIQFGVSVRDTALYDAAGSSMGFESDNDATGSFASPATNPTFSNMTVIGPRRSDTVTTSISSFFSTGALLRRNTRLNLHNSIVMGWPRGLDIDGKLTPDNFVRDSARVSNTFFVGNRTKFVEFDSIVDQTNIRAYFSRANAGNDSTLNLATGGLVDAYSKNPNFSPINNIYNNATNFAGLDANFFTTVPYVGAFPIQGGKLSNGWLENWTNFDPQTTVYDRATAVNELANVSTRLFPNPATNATTLQLNVTEASRLNVSIVDMLGREVIRLGATEYATGVHNVTIDVNGLNSGLHYVRILGENGQKTMPLSILK